MSKLLPKLPILTLFHNPSSKESVQALKHLKRVVLAKKFKLDLVQAKFIPPTPHQIETIVHYLGQGDVEAGLSQILVDTAPKASTIAEVNKILEANPQFLRRPLIVDWSKGRAIIADPPEVAKRFAKDAGNTE